MKKTIHKVLLEEFEHISQPTGHSCGPTCMKMVHDYFIGDVFQTDEICEACGTDWVVGTPPDKLITGLDWMGIEYQHHISMEEPYDFLRNVFSNNNIAIVRTITHGVPHWIVVRGWDDDKGVFIVNDPWLGPKEYTEEQLEEVWVPRDYEFFEISGAKPMEPLKKEIGEPIVEPFKNRDEVVEAIKLAIPIFSKQMPPKNLATYLIAAVDWKLSVKAVVDNKIVGFYFLSESDVVNAVSFYCMKTKENKNKTGEEFYSSEDELKIPEIGEYESCEVFIDLNEYVNKRGLEGVGLGVDPQYKGMGVGKKLIDYSLSLDFDYIWGMQYESLGNIRHWLKRRKLVAIVPGIFFTLQDLK